MSMKTLKLIENCYKHRIFIDAFHFALDIQCSLKLQFISKFSKNGDLLLQVANQIMLIAIVNY